MTTENATPTRQFRDVAEPPAIGQDDVLHAWIEERRPTRHRLGERPGTEVHATQIAGVRLKQAPAELATTRLSAPAPSLLARILGGAR